METILKNIITKDSVDKTSVIYVSKTAFDTHCECCPSKLMDKVITLARDSFGEDENYSELVQYHTTGSIDMENHRGKGYALVVIKNPFGFREDAIGLAMTTLRSSTKRKPLMIIFDELGTHPLSDDEYLGSLIERVCENKPDKDSITGMYCI